LVFVAIAVCNEECVPCGLIHQKDGIRSLNQERLYGSSRRKRHEEYQCIVKDKVAEAEWKYFDVNEHWQQMENIMMDTAQVTCGLSKGPCRYKETWWWNEEWLNVESCKQCCTIAQGF